MCIFFLSQAALGKVESLSTYCWTLPSRWTLEWADPCRGHRLRSLWGGWRCMCSGRVHKRPVKWFFKHIRELGRGSPMWHLQRTYKRTPWVCQYVTVTSHRQLCRQRRIANSTDWCPKLCSPLCVTSPCVDPWGATSSKLVQGAVKEIGQIKREGHGSLPTPGHGDGAGGEQLWIGWIWIWDH